jgi:hypothetical protein
MLLTEFGWCKMASEGTLLGTLIKLSRSPLGFAVAGLIWSAINDGVAIGIAHLNGMRGQLFVVNGVHNQYLVLFHVAVAYIVFPAVWAFNAWTDQAPRRMLRNLRENGVFAEGDGDEEADRAAYLGFDQRLWSFLYAVGILLILTGSYVLWFNPPAHEPGIVFNIRSHLPSTLVLWFMLWLILCKIAETIFALDKVFRNRKVCLFPFHPDHVGGFGGLERYARGLLFFFGFVFFGLLIDFLQTISIRRETHDVILAIYIWAFVLLVPVLFWGILWPGHTAMIRERDRILRSLISDEWQRTSFGYANDATSTRRQLEHAEAARKLHDTVMGFPVWPFRFGPDVLLPLSESFAAAAVAHLLVNLLLHSK